MYRGNCAVCGNSQNNHLMISHPFTVKEAPVSEPITDQEDSDYVKAQKALVQEAFNGLLEDEGKDHALHTRLALQLAADSFNHKMAVAASHAGLDDDQAPHATAANFYIVSFKYTLGYWKALVSTNVVDNHYWELTFNLAEEEAYVDTYIKEHNECIPIINYR